MFRKCCCAQVFADVMAQECCARSGFTQHWWVMLATDSIPHFWLLDLSTVRYFWLLPHSAPVGIDHRIYSAGFYFNFFSFINLHPNLDSFVSRNITKGCSATLWPNASDQECRNYTADADFLSSKAEKRLLSRQGTTWVKAMDSDLDLNKPVLFKWQEHKQLKRDTELSTLNVGHL